jgi:soluble lytic murein transglycosylase
VGKLASQRGIALDDIAFPMFGVPQHEALPRSAEQPVVYSIARQESAFQSDALSHAGARGLMQMLPSTARRTAQRAGVPFDEKRLVLDPAYNAQLGAAHLTELMDEHGQSLILTFAAYNAGGHRVKQWIAAYGDPRKSDVDPIDWVERIPFTETRNYVQRVVENVGVYRARFGAPDAKGLIVDDLRARQVRLAASQ